jgi:hypothetical protein
MTLTLIGGFPFWLRHAVTRLCTLLFVRQNWLLPYNFKITRPVKRSIVRTNFGPKLLYLTLLDIEVSEGSFGVPAMTPIAWLAEPRQGTSRAADPAKLSVLATIRTVLAKTQIF